MSAFDRCLGIGVLLFLRFPPPPENLFTAALVGPSGPAVPKSIASVNLLIARLR